MNYKAMVTKKCGSGIKTDTQINGTQQTSEKSSCIYSQLILDKGTKIYTGERAASVTNDA
jgi:hypothetical protein